MEPEGTLPHSQGLVTCPYSEPYQCSPCPHTTSWRLILILHSHVRLGLPNVSFPGFPRQNIVSTFLFHLRATCPTHFILLYFVSQIIFCGKYTSQVSPLGSLLHPPVNSSLLNPNIFLCAFFSAYVPTSMWENKFHTHKKTCRIIVLHILCFVS